MQRMIRLFISSTFKNFTEERNAMITQICPKLKEYCKKHGFSFHVLDLRWGVPIQATMDNRAMQICLDEIEHCQRLSPNLNFLLMIGTRSGWQPAPSMIPHDEWILLTSAISKLHKTIPGSLPTKISGGCWNIFFREKTSLDTYLHNKWYDYSKDDDEYILRDYAEHIPENEIAALKAVFFSEAIKLLQEWYYIDKNDLCNNCYLRARSKKDDRDWSIIEKILWHILSYLSRYCPMDSQALQKYTLSATSQEICNGLLNLSKNAGENVFALFENEEKSKESDESKAQTDWLKEKVRAFLPKSHICENDADYINRIYDFLLNRIKKQIAQAEERTEYEQDEQALQTELRFVQKNYCKRPELQRQFDELRRYKSGQFILVTGSSGSGKSYFLKYQAILNPESTAAVYTDILPRRRSFSNTISFLFKQLEKKGLIEDVSQIPADSYQLVPWIKSHLDKLKKEKNITIILDCVENIRDWKEITGSLFQLRLPPYVTFIVGCISENSLNKRDLKYNFHNFNILPLSKSSAQKMLMEKLSMHGRCLQPEQWKCIDRNMPETPSPLHMELISVYCQTLNSEDKIKTRIIKSAYVAVYDLFFRGGKKEYSALRRHILGFISLSNVGLTESELTELLKNDEDAVQELRCYHNDWRNDLENMIREDFPSAPWARIYFEIQPFLNELEQDGVILFQFRHRLMTEYVQSIIGAKLLRKLNEDMKCFFRRQPWKYVSDNQAILPNRRKIQELPNLFYRSDKPEDITEWLEDPCCIDCFVRCEKLLDAVSLLTDSSIKYGTSRRREKILALLKKKQELFQAWPDSFLQSAASAGLAYPINLREYHKNCWIKSNGDNEFPRSFIFHEIAADVLALNDNNILASFFNGVVRLADLNLGVVTDVLCHVDIGVCAMYWVKDKLILRAEYERVTLIYTDNELYEESREKCIGWTKISAPEDVNDRDPYTWAEYELFVNSECKYIQFRGRSSVKKAHLPYSKKDVPSVRLCGSMAAVLVKGYVLEIIDLENSLLLNRQLLPPVKNIIWASSGNALLIILEDGHMLLNPTVTGSYIRKIDLSAHDEADFFLMKGIINIFKEFASILAFIGVDIQRIDMAHKNGYLTLHEGDASKQTDRFPQLLTFSARKKRIACYYRYGQESLLRIYALDSRRIISECSVTPVYQYDTKSPALYFIHDGEELVFVSGGIYHVLNVETGKWKRESSRPEAAGDESAVVSDIRKKYADRMITRAAGKYMLDGEDKKSSPRNKERKSFGEIIFDGFIKAFLFIISVLFTGVMPRTMNRFKRELFMQDKLQTLPVCVYGDIVWLVDNINNMIHICDKQGNWLCHEQLDMNISWADIDGGNLMILSKYTGMTAQCEIRWI